MLVDRFFFIFATMKNIKLTFLILCSLAIFSCNDDEDPVKVCVSDESDYVEINVITGMDFFDANGSALGRWGFPNHKLGNALVYPIPSTGVLSVSSQEKIEKIWLTPAVCLKDSVTADITMLSQDLNYSASQVETIQVKEVTIADFNNNVNLDFGDVGTGMYRLFYQLDSGNIFWYNLYIDPSATSFPDFDFMENGCD